MSVERELQTRSEEKCELCGATYDLQAYVLAPRDGAKSDDCIMACAVCAAQMDGTVEADANHWRCLNESMWSTVPAVQVAAYRMLYRLRDLGWTQDLLDMMYLDEESLEWAKSGEAAETDDADPVHRDSNGVVLVSGDNITLIKDLEVKGAGFTAKRGTPVRGITLVRDNTDHIEGRVNGQQIVLLTKYVRKM